ncbi:MAG: hypothetical protein R3D85_07280 [Paracoccaceae bacterium]
MEFRFSGQAISVNVPDASALLDEVRARFRRGEDSRWPRSTSTIW